MKWLFECLNSQSLAAHGLKIKLDVFPKILHWGRRFLMLWKIPRGSPIFVSDYNFLGGRVLYPHSPLPLTLLCIYVWKDFWVLTLTNEWNERNGTDNAKPNGALNWLQKYENLSLDGNFSNENDFGIISLIILCRKH